MANFGAAELVTIDLEPYRQLAKAQRMHQLRICLNRQDWRFAHVARELGGELALLRDLCSESVGRMIVIGGDLERQLARGT